MRQGVRACVPSRNWQIGNPISPVGHSHPSPSSITLAPPSSVPPARLDYLHELVKGPRRMGSFAFTALLCVRGAPSRLGSSINVERALEQRHHSMNARHRPHYFEAIIAPRPISCFAYVVCTVRSEMYMLAAAAAAAAAASTVVPRILWP